MPHHGRTVAKALGLKGDLAKEAEDVVGKLYTAFMAKDMEMLEINPLIVTKDGHLRCLDAKISFDSNALYRHPDIVRCATSRRRTRRRSRPPSTTSPTSRSTAPSAAW
jgi:succinyl-CoA synthetase beta subunit